MFVLDRLDNTGTTIQGNKGQWSLLYHQIKTVDIVAAFYNFYADIAVNEIVFY